MCIHHIALLLTYESYKKRRILTLIIAMEKKLLNRRFGWTLSLNTLAMITHIDIRCCDRLPNLFLFFMIYISQINYTSINLLVICVPRVFS